jgi:lysophospholipase L1-like esterase
MKAKRLITLAATGALLIVAVIGYLYFWQSHPIGTGPAGPQIQTAPFSHAWTEKQVLVVGIGDSVTAGFGARRGYSYFDRLIANPSDEFPEIKDICLRMVIPHLQFTNLAASGSTSGQHIEKQLPLLPVAQSNVVGLIVMTTGGNDLIHNYGRTPPREQAMYGSTWKQATPWIANFEQRLNLMIEQINSRFPAGCHIFLANIFDPTDGFGDVQHPPAAL